MLLCAENSVCTVQVTHCTLMMQQGCESKCSQLDELAVIRLEGSR